LSTLARTTSLLPMSFSTGARAGIFPSPIPARSQPNLHE